MLLNAPLGQAASAIRLNRLLKGQSITHPRKNATWKYKKHKPLYVGYNYVPQSPSP